MKFTDDRDSIDPTKLRDLMAASYGVDMPPRKRDVALVTVALANSFTVQAVFLEPHSNACNLGAPSQELIAFARQ